MKVCFPAKLLLRNLYRQLASKNSWNQKLILDPFTCNDLECCCFFIQGQLLEAVECHIYLYCFTFDDINLNRALVIFVLFSNKI